MELPSVVTGKSDEDDTTKVSRSDEKDGLLYCIDQTHRLLRTSDSKQSPTQ